MGVMKDMMGCRGTGSNNFFILGGPGNLKPLVRESLSYNQTLFTSFLTVGLHCIQTE
jgi:hypothetical protein